MNPREAADRLRHARSFIEVGIAVCELTRELGVRRCIVAVHGPDGQPSLTVDNAAEGSDQERLRYITEALDDPFLRELRMHHAPVSDEQIGSRPRKDRGCFVLPILAPGHLLGSIRCEVAHPLTSIVRRDLTTLANHVSVRLADLGITATRDPQIAQLTRRQLEVAHARGTGKTAGQIGDLLGISENTVKKHLKDIYVRLSVGNRTELAARMRHDPPHEAGPVGVSRVGAFAVTRGNLATQNAPAATVRCRRRRAVSDGKSP